MNNFRNLKLAGVAFLGFGAAFSSTSATADFVILDDLIVDGSACIGFDCVNGESFSFDTIRLKENNLRIKFDDTSVANSFPRNDWQITANDSANGGLSKFSIDDISGSRTPFTIEAGARSHSLYVDDGGRIGVRTNTPSLELHIVDGDTPAVRLEQDGSSGFAPQTWDIAGNETNFFIRDVTNGSQLPFRIRPDAPTSSIFIDVDGLIGFGTSSPGALLSLVRGGTGAGGLPRIMFDNTDATEDWVMDVADNNQFRISVDGSGSQEFAMTAAGDLTITGEITTSGSCSGGCDLVFDPDYDLPSMDEQAAAMWKNRYLPNVGPTPENGPFNLSTKVGGMLNELEKAHIYIDQLNQRIAKLEATAGGDTSTRAVEKTQ
jgi:hypothetical protein